MSEIEFIPYNRPWIDDADIDRVADVLRSGWWTTGPVTREFEQRFAEYVGVEHAVAMNSCTAALHVALVALGVGAGDLVVTTTLTFASTAEVAVYLGAIPVLLDVDGDTLNISAAQVSALCDSLSDEHPFAALERAVADGLLPAGVLRCVPRDADISSVKAIVPVHFAGQVCAMDEILEVASVHGIPVLEDAAHAVETTYGEKHAGTLGAIGAFSFYATKNLSTGEGGMATTNDPELAARMRSLTLHGISRDAWRRYTASGSWRYDIQEAGFKYNLTDVAAALGVGQLERIGMLHDRRSAIVRQYNELLDDVPGLALPVDKQAGVHAWHLYVVRVISDGSSALRDALIDGLQAQGIGSSVHFIPLHLHSYYQKRFGFGDGDYPVAEQAFDEIISLPLYPSMTESEIVRVATGVRDVLGKLDARG